MSIESIHKEERIFHPSEKSSKNARVSDLAKYTELCESFKKDYLGTWGELAKEHLIWDKPFSSILDDKTPPFFKWFEDGKLNASYNCLDKHASSNPNKTAIIFEADDGQVKKITYLQLLKRVCQFSNGLKTLKLDVGDRVIIYLPMGIEAVVAMQACARLGLTHSVVFGGFSAKSLQERISDTEAKLVITSDGQFRGGKVIPLKQAIDEAINMGGCESVEKVIVYKRTNEPFEKNDRDIMWESLIDKQSDECPAVSVPAEHPLFILYTSGSTGKPKGVQHSTAGYLLHAINTCRLTFDLHDNDIYWCTADVGWITGHTYVAYGPTAIGATQVIFEGVPTYPDASRFWQLIEKHKVSVFYTAPTAIRALTKASEINKNTHPKNFDLSSLRILGTVGEPINPEAWMWYYENVGI